MAEPMKIRATHQGEFTEVKVLLQHPMETGQRRDPKTGNNLPPHFIQIFSLAVNGKPMVQAQLNTSVAKNPVLTFRLQGVKAGDRLQAQWHDNKGDSRSDEAVVGA